MLCLFQAINYSIIKLMISIESGILLKNHVSCNFMLKYYITLLPDNLQKLQISFFTYLVQTKIWKFVYPFDLYN